MRFSILFAVLVVSVAAKAQVPEQYRGDWLLVNGVVVLNVQEDGNMTLRNSGAKGAIAIKESGEFTWRLPDATQVGKFSEGRLLLKNDQADGPAWTEYLEFRKASKEQASEVIEYALRQQNQMAGAFERVRRTSMEKAILNNLRQLAAAADMYFLEHGVNKVTFDQIVGPEKYIKSLSPVDGEDYRALDLTSSAKTWKITSNSGITVTYER